jgi:hypothetical protein
MVIQTCNSRYLRTRSISRVRPNPGKVAGTPSQKQRVGGGAEDVSQVVVFFKILIYSFYIYLHVYTSFEPPSPLPPPYLILPSCFLIFLKKKT